MFKYILTFFLLLPVVADTMTGKVVKVVDGDTIHLLLENHTIEKIRLAGIDAPEKRQAHGSKAKKYLSSILVNQSIAVKYNKRDRYGRIVGKILFKGTDVNLKIVQVGYAWHYKKYQREQSQDDRLSYAVAENNARKFNLGLFQNEAIPPWDWRKNRKNLRKLKHQQTRPAQTLLSSSGYSNATVWVNLKSGKYHCPGTRYYNNTKSGKMIKESAALQEGYRGAHGLRCQ